MKTIAAVLLVTMCAVAVVSGQTMFESFEAAWTNGGATPAGWTKTNVSGSGEWGQKIFPLSGQLPPSGSLPFTGRAVAWFAANQDSGTTTRLESPSLDFSSLANPYMKLSFSNRTGSDSLKVLYSTDGGTNWTEVVRYGPINLSAWQVRYTSLTNLAGQSGVKIGLEAVADSGTSDIWVDHLLVSGRDVTISQIQEVPLDWLLLSDTLQLTNQARWALQRSPYFGDTVTVTAVCVVPAYPRWQPPTNDPLGAITFTRVGWTMLLADTGSNPYPWGGILVRVCSSCDTVQAALDGFLNVERGDVIRMTGLADEFPAGVMNSTTQFVPIPGQQIQIVGSGMSIPQYVNKTVSDFYRGIFQATGQAIRFSTGEPFEGCLVNLATPLTLDGLVNTARGTFSMVDGNGNQITNYDASKFFTLAGGTTDHPGPDPIWSIIYSELVPPRQIDTMRGFITTVSTSENPRGYRISPIYRVPYGANDVVFGVVLPSVTTHRRNPVVVLSDSAPQISVRVTRQPGGYPIATVNLLYSLDNGPFTSLPMTFQAGDTAVAQIPQQPENTFVHYFIKATDSLGNSAMLASSAFGGASSDTSRGFFFYTVLNRPLTIHDIQYTPYTNGRSGYLGANVSVNGVVTADTAHFRISPISNGGASTWYMQDGNQPWNGIWFVPAPTEDLLFLQNGDSITVTGTVAEQFDVTRLQPASVVRHVSGRPEPEPVVSTTGTFGVGVGNGEPTAEQYEGMLARFNNVRMTARYPEFNDRREFEIDDGTGPVRVLRDGRHTISNDTLDIPFGYTVLNENDTITHVVGIIHFSFNKYKFVPRTNADFGEIITSVKITRDPVVPSAYALAQNYPNPFNPSTVIEYNLPNAVPVRLKVYNVLGQVVRILVDEHQSPGKYKVRFDASRFSTGVYFYSLQAGEFRQVKKMLLLK